MGDNVAACGGAGHNGGVRNGGGVVPKDGPARNGAYNQGDGGAEADSHWQQDGHHNGDGSGTGSGGKGDDTGKKKRDRGENGGRHKSCQQGRKVPGGSKLADHPAERIGEHHNRCNGDHIAAAG